MMNEMMETMETVTEEKGMSFIGKLGVTSAIVLAGGAATKFVLIPVAKKIKGKFFTKEETVEEIESESQEPTVSDEE